MSYQPSPKKDFVRSLAGAYGSHDTVAFTAGAHARAYQNPAYGHTAFGKTNTTKQAPTSHPATYSEKQSQAYAKTYEPSIASSMTMEKPLLGEKKSHSNPLKKLFS